MATSQRSRYGYGVLSAFDVRPNSRDFLADVIESAGASVEAQVLLRQSLTAGAEDWHYLIECAESIRRARGDPSDESLDEQDVLAFVWKILVGWEAPLPASEPWEQTDRLIAKAKALEQDLDLWPLSSIATANLNQCLGSSQFTTKSKNHRTTTSHYWSSLGSHQTATPLIKRSSTISPYFPLSSTEETKKSPVRRRPPPGTIATVSFAPLTAPRFGLVQELFAHDPFWLLIAVTFLVKTKGKVAMPVFYKVKERFPTPTDIANPSNRDEIVDMIRHLGLSSNRVTFMQRYARGFLSDPPKPGVRYRVKNYDSRDIDPAARALSIAGDSVADEDTGTILTEGSPDNLESWEIGHLTQGKYALDSWRIFCRDELLGRAEDWNGKGREAQFQPEWMRVMPHDKELRAYLRWMWMREGWEWDPDTGERTVLREEMRRAVNEGRVEYDFSGGLRILDS
ncbi:DNA glycosylase [Mariannaea sp. PMI_226]|nr:DNA glycosylase [Mariannaea sp. PMI_226]